MVGKEEGIVGRGAKQNYCQKGQRKTCEKLHMTPTGKTRCKLISADFHYTKEPLKVLHCSAVGSQVTHPS